MTYTKSESNRLPILAAQIKIAHAGVEDAAKTAAERAIEAGEALVEAKALVKHGQWLPWLKEHCELPERTAQFYMKIAKLGLKPATVADLGLKAAAKTIAMQYPDPFSEESEEIRNAWFLYVTFLVDAGFEVDGAGDRIDWLRRKAFNLPDEWMSREADRFREMCLMPPIPQKVRDQWEAWKAKRKGWGKAEIQVEYDRLCAEQKAALAAAPHRHP